MREEKCGKASVLKFFDSFYAKTQSQALHLTLSVSLTGNAACFSVIFLCDCTLHLEYNACGTLKTKAMHDIYIYIYYNIYTIYLMPGQRARSGEA